MTLMSFITRPCVGGRRRSSSGTVSLCDCSPCDDALGGVLNGVELAAAQEPALQDLEEQLDLIEP
jgi:hypothetical protein